MMVSDDRSVFTEFLTTVNAMNSGYQTVVYHGRSYGVTLQHAANGRITKLLAQELGGTDRVSFNLFKTGENRHSLKPCEMSSKKVIDFVLQSRSENN